MKKVTIPVKDITKIKNFNTATIIYTEKTVWVCVPNQALPKKDDMFITLTLLSKGKSE